MMAARGSPAFLLVALAAASGGAEPLVVEGKFSIEPPPGWNSIDTQEASVQARAIAKRLRLGNLQATAPLAIFASAVNKLGFVNNLNIREVDDLVSPSPSNLEQYKSHMEKGFGPLRPKVRAAEVVPGGNGKLYMRLEAEYEIQGVPLRMIQAVLPGRGGTFIATYTVHAGSLDRERPEIDASLQSFRNLEPWYRWFTARPYVTVGILVGFVVVVAAMARRMRRRKA
jgi:hypothetical protein